MENFANFSEKLLNCGTPMTGCLPSKYLPVQSQQKNTRKRCKIYSELTIKISE